MKYCGGGGGGAKKKLQERVNRAIMNSDSCMAIVTIFRGEGVRVNLENGIPRPGGGGGGG